MKHSVSTSTHDDSGVAALPPACWGFGGLHPTLLASLSFSDNHHLRDFIWYQAHLENCNLLVESTNPVLGVSFFPPSIPLPITKQKGIFIPVKAAISQCLSYQSKDETTRNQPTEENLQGGQVGKWLPRSQSHAYPKGRAAQPDLTPQLILSFSEAWGVLVHSHQDMNPHSHRLY